MPQWYPSRWPEFVYHFSEDPAIERFVPHVPPTNPGAGAHVWAIDGDHAPLYWFPRECPRVTVWARDAGERSQLESRFDTTSARVHWVEHGRLTTIAEAELFVYELDAAPFAPWAEAEGQWIADDEIVPRSVVPLGNCIDRHRAAGVDLRVVDDLWPHVDAVVACGLPFSIVRLRNARPRPVS